jgi:hypothetical protein
MKDWIELQDIPEVRRPITEAPGLNIELSVSPYDIPQAVRGYVDEAKGSFIIEFKYPGEEPTHGVELKDAIRASIGNSSERIYKIEIDLRTLAPERIGLHLKQSVERLASSAIDQMEDKTPENRVRYRINHAAIRNTDSKLFRGLGVT